MINTIFKIIIIGGIALLSACAQLPTNFEAKPSYALTDTESTALGNKSKKALGDSLEESKMYLMVDGVDAFVARGSLLSLAERSIDVQYYIWHSDLIGKLLFGQVLLAADRGVRVRMLLDDMPIDSATETIIYGLDQHKNIEVRLFNPFASRSFRFADYVVSPMRINRRMHNKSFTVDNQFTITGGRNIGEEYFYANENVNFKDIDVIAIGPVVKDIGNQFDTYWNSAVVYPVTAFDHNSATEESLDLVRKELSEFRASEKGSKYHLDVQDSEMYQSLKRKSFPKDHASRIFKGPVQVIYDDPEKSLGKSHEEVTYLKSLLDPYLDKTDKTLEIISPYFVPGSRGVEFLTDMVKRGVKVRVITNSLSSTDGLMAQSGYSRRRYELLVGGVELYELKTDLKIKTSKSLRRGEHAKSGLHAKTYIIDREQVFIGSFNFDQRSLNINSEVGVVYDVPEMADLIATTVFDEKLNDLAYKVELADKDIEIDDIEIDEDDIYWIETDDGKQTYYVTEPETGFWRRFGQGFFSIMPIESQL